MVYLAMSYLYGRRFVGPINDIILSLRRELYTIPYHLIDWKQARNLCAKEDMYIQRSKVQEIILSIVNVQNVGEPLLMHWPFSKLRQKALNHVMQHIHYEDENSNYICLGPVNKGKNGCQLWEAALAVQAILATKLDQEYSSMLKKANTFVKETQIKRNTSGDPSRWYRHISKGGWPFSTADNSWIVSDCIAEGMKASILLSRLPCEIVGEAIETERLFDAANVLLSMQ
ncbi:hypothetical protein PIB30_050669, partial [Stylosanthes scabra]|nr:hypothetical protein [Stylosanthes scabra]